MRRVFRANRLAALVLALYFCAYIPTAPVFAANGVRVGSEATVQSDDGLNIRQEPNPASQVLASADVNDFVYVLAGPQPVGSTEWFQVEYEGVTGWAVGEFLGAARERASVSTRGSRGGIVAPDSVSLPVPYYSQFDGSFYQSGNCGPATMVMVFAAFGKSMNVGDMRNIANRIQGTTGVPDAGVGIDILANLANENGLVARGLRLNGGYDRWSMDEVRQTLRNGNLLVPQVHLASMPGHATSNRSVDHYIIITGYEGKFFRYNDSAFSGTSGRGLLMSEETLSTAWKRSDYPYAAFSVGPGVGVKPLIAPPVPVVAPRLVPTIPRMSPRIAPVVPSLPIPQMPLPSAPILLPPPPVSPDTMASLTRLQREEQETSSLTAQATDGRLTGSQPDLRGELGASLVSALADQSQERETIQRAITSTTSTAEVAVATGIAFGLALLGARRQWVWRNRRGRGTGWTGGAPSSVASA